MKQLLHFILKKLAKKILRRFRPFVIGITGSVGKTSTKEMIYAVLKKHFKARRNEKNYNNELGVPLTIIDSESGNRSVVKWLKVFLKALNLAYSRKANYCDILILEMGADKSNDIQYLMEFVPCDIGVLTAVAPAHLEKFNNIENVFKEKSKIITRLTNAHAAVINGDNSKIMELRNKTKAKVYSYGFNPDNDFMASDQKIILKKGIIGTGFKLHFKGTVIPVFVPNLLGKPAVYSCLASLAVANIMNIEVPNALDNLSLYQPPKGRLNLILGVKDTIILDDSYNSSPDSAKAALEVLTDLPAEDNSKRIAVLGDMLELGEYAEKGHRDVGKKAAEFGIDLLVGVGNKAKNIVEEAVKNGMAREKTAHFMDHKEVTDFLLSKISSKDIILIKGSQGARMEKVVADLMAEPEKAKDLLVRQGEEWKT